MSILIEGGGTTAAAILVDTSPDLREQLLAASVSRLDAVLYTHEHADHLHGIDDLRSLNRRQRQVIPIFADSTTLKAIERRFRYVLEPPPLRDGRPVFYKPCLEAHEITAGQPFKAAGLDILPIEQDHGYMTTLGFRFGAAAYSTDLVNLSDAACKALTDLKLWIVDCFCYEPHPTHAHLAKVLQWVERVKPDRTVLTHMGPSLDYRRLQGELPRGVEPGFDGMVLDVEDSLIRDDAISQQSMILQRDSGAIGESS